MERCECIINRLMQALQELAGGMVNHQQNTRQSMTDSGQQLDNINEGELNESNSQMGNNNLLVFGIIAMLILSLFLRNRQQVGNNYTKISKLPDKNI